MNELLQQLVNGLSLGLVYGLIALGYTMVYGIVRMINFAHGELYMLGAMVAATFITLLWQNGVTDPLPLVLVALPASVVFVTGYALLSERLAYRPLRTAPRLAPLISAIGLSLFLQHLIPLLLGPRDKSIPLKWQTLSFTLLEGGEGAPAVTISALQLIVAAVTLALLAGLAFVIQRTALGRAQRACSQDLTMAALLGIPVNRVIAITFALGGGLAAVAGTLETLQRPVIDSFIGYDAGIKAFTAAVLGGIGSLPGAVAGGLLLGVVEALWQGFATSAYRDVATFTLLIVMLTLRPQGLFGRAEVEKV